MNVTRRIAVAAAAFAALAGVAAATPATAMAAPAAHVAVVDRSAASTATAVRPDTRKWIYFGSYPTLSKCNSAGDHEVFFVNGTYTFKCVEYSQGELFIWKLFIGVPA